MATATRSSDRSAVSVPDRQTDRPSSDARLDAAAAGLAPDARALLERALDFVRPLYQGRTLGTGEAALAHALGAAEHLAVLRLDAATRAAGLLFAVPEYLPEYRESVAAAFGADVTSIVANVARLHQLRLVTRGLAQQEAAARAAQTEVLRKMLLAMVEDIRAVLVRLASRTQTLRYLEYSPMPMQETIARETLDIYAPLANRLGVWQLKWQLEDVAFRILEPESFKRVVALIDEGRGEREAFIERCIAAIRKDLVAAGVKAEITGRPKHLYSIWNKMQRKSRAFAELYDLRAIRVLVDNVRDCYTALGVVHNLWQPIPEEFDDYVSRPKANEYRSLHTAVLGPDGKPVEVQIRTHDMHREAELGVAAHWRYKETGRSEGGAGGKAASYEEKIGWLRQVLAWRDEIVDGAEWVDQTKNAALDDTVYVLTPQGRVVDLPRGSTPIDLAYYIHTDLGHRCRGAKVDGAMVPLDHKLENGQTVEVTAAKQGGPSRDWLNPERGYLGSHRARVKVRQWFNAIEQGEMVAAGRAVVERELQREGKTGAKLEELAKRLGLDSPEAMFVAVAREDIGPRQLHIAIRGDAPPEPVADAAPVAREARSGKGSSGILVVGVDRLMTQLAKCCRPVPPDPIAGFVTRGRGVSIHRRSCPSLIALLKQQPERALEVQWGAQADGVFAADVFVQAHDRQGLLRDVSDVFTRNRINVIGVNTQSRAGIATMQFTVEVPDMSVLTRGLDQIREVSGVFVASRR
jgi:GTP pyrophosphokinase